MHFVRAVDIHTKAIAWRIKSEFSLVTGFEV